MPPKLRKDRSSQGSKATPSNTNMYNILNDDHQTKMSAKTTTDKATVAIPSQTPAEAQMKTMQHDIASMAQVIQVLSNSIHKMDKLDKIDELEARQKSSETMLNEMVSDLRTELDTIKTPQSNTPVIHTPSYAHITKTTQKSHKNNNDMEAEDDNESNIQQKPTNPEDDTLHPTTTNQVAEPDRQDDPTPTTNYTNQNTFTPHPFIHPFPPMHQSSHQQWMHANKRWTENSNQLPPYQPTTNNGTIPTAPAYQPTQHTQDLQDDDHPHQGNPSTHKYWKLAASETHQPHRFLQYMDNIHLDGDTITHLRQFYERIRLAFHSSFTKPTDILPTFRNMSPNQPFRTLLIPQNEYYIGYHSITNTYNWYSTALYAGLTDKKTIPPKVAPLAARVITTDKKETDGLQ